MKSALFYHKKAIEQRTEHPITLPELPETD
jgi:hypothetical protein